MNSPTNEAASADGVLKPTAAATFCATIVDEWARSGIEAAFVAPGSRSTPLVLALLNNDAVEVHIFHDERAASFAALGHASATGKPSLVACSSGTAAAHFYAAVLEASASSVPLIICSADRPIELKGIAAPQTIDQTKLYGDAVRYFTEPGVPLTGQSHWWRSWASRLAAEAQGWAGSPGPVHANLAFREPLLGEPGELPQGRSDAGASLAFDPDAHGAAWHRAPLPDTRPNEADVLNLARRVSQAAGVILCGRGTSDPAAVVELAEKLDWPLLADHRSGAREPSRSVSHSDLLLRNPHFAAAHKPQIVLRFGEIHASKVLSQWLRAAEPFVVTAVPHQHWIDPERLANLILPEPGLAAALLASAPLAEHSNDLTNTAGQRKAWMQADVAAAAAIHDVLDAEPEDCEPKIARTVIGNAPTGSHIVLSSSMPVRDVEWFAEPRTDITVLSNRGTNGIDGVTSTAIGVALAGHPTTLLIGDIAFLHDSTALVGLADRDIDLHIVVVDNDGGGIFSFLPQANELPTSSFETLFGTPHNTDLTMLCTAHNIAVQPWTEAPRVAAGISVSVATTNRADNVRVHAELVRRVVDAIS